MVTDKEKTLLELERAIIRLEDSEKVKERVKKALDNGISPTDITNSLRKGLEGIGERYEKREYFLMELIVAGNLASEIMSVLKPSISQEKKLEGKILIGTVHGDLHDIGKNLVVAMFSSMGFTVVDLGVDVPPERFVEMTRKEKPDVLALSTLLSIGVPQTKLVIEKLKEAGLRNKVKVMVGGRPITREYAQEIGADGYAEDAISAVKTVSQWLTGSGGRKP
jgi:5-methyltetrahydrofolate--homocysteine methyltransferase